jgi:eukaryotic-like serine/threonine-protein kinase
MSAAGLAFWRRWPAANWRPGGSRLESSTLTGPSEMPGVEIGGYALVRTFAHGALGELHLATHPQTGQPVAIKTVRLHGGELTRERFMRESSAAARLRHAGIVRCQGTGVEGTGERAFGWIAMEWVAGSDLSRYTHPPRLLPEPLVLGLVGQAARALAHAHRQGVVHRDLKPANLLFDPRSSTLKITDFGCAHLSDAERSRSGVMAGTPVYMAPEQLTGAPVDGRCDLYALGVLLFELLTGRLPFEAHSLGDLLQAVSTTPAPSLASLRPDLPAALSGLLERLLAKRAGDRPPSGDDVADELEKLAAGMVSPEGGSTTDTGTMAQTTRPRPT